MQPLFFGSSDSALFGMYHAPRRSASPTRGVLLCSPIGHEYLRAHRALRQLASTLAQRGMHVFRFDYFGTGDSAGDGEDGSVDRWLRDVDGAIDELKAMAAIPTVSVVGLRFGAFLAVRRALARADVEEVILWDPIIDGARYVSDMAGSNGSTLDARREPTADVANVMGFPLTRHLRDELEAIDLRKLSGRKMDRAGLVVSNEDEAHDDLNSSLHEWAQVAYFDHVPSSGDWTESDDIGSALLPQHAIRQIVMRLTGGPR